MYPSKSTVLSPSSSAKLNQRLVSHGHPAYVAFRRPTASGLEPTGPACLPVYPVLVGFELFTSCRDHESIRRWQGFRHLGLGRPTTCSQPFDRADSFPPQQL